MTLDDIIFNKRQEATLVKLHLGVRDPMNFVKKLVPPRDFLDVFKKGKLSLIAELKKASPSAGVILEDYDPALLARTYEESGASALSVLTDQKYFMGKLEDIRAAKGSAAIPILRKDFIIDESQIYESRMGGADAILLIARVLEDGQLARFLQITEKIKMQALVEVHNEEEVKRALMTDAKIIGINNRDLDTLEVDLNRSITLMHKFPELKERIVISESGIKTQADVRRLREAGVDGILVGESILKSMDIPGKIRELLG